MDFTDNTEVEEELAGQPPEESPNRTFIIIAVILGGLFLLGLVCIAVYALLIYPNARQAQLAAQSTLEAQATEVAFIAEQTSIAASWSPTPKPTNTKPPEAVVTNTPVVAQSMATNTPLPTIDPTQATLDALLTEVALAQLTVIPTSTSLPEGGFADEVGAPALLAAAVVLVVVIFLARRLRTA